MSPTRNDLLRNAVLKGVLAFACFVAGAFAVYLALDMVSIFGEGMGVDERSRRIYANAHIAVHIFGTISAIVIGVFIATRARFMAGLAIAAMLLCGGYGVINMIGFTSTNRISVAAAKEASVQADERQYLDARKAKEDEIKWLRSTIVTEESRWEKRRLEKELSTKQRELEAMQPPKPSATMVLADPQATLFASLVGWTAKNWQMALPIPVAFLVYAAEALSFIFGVHLLFSAITDLRASMASGMRGSGSDDASGGGRRRIKLVSDADDAERKPAVKSAMQPEYSGAEQPRSAASVNRASAPVHMPDSLSDYLHEYAKGQWPRRAQTAIARDFGVSQPTVSRQLRRAQERAERKRARSEARMTMQGGYGGGMLMHAPPTI